MEYYVRYSSGAGENCRECFISQNNNLFGVFNRVVLTVAGYRRRNSICVIYCVPCPSINDDGYVSRTYQPSYNDFHYDEELMTLPSRPYVSCLYYGTLIHTPVLGDIEILTNTGVGVDEHDGTIKFIVENKPLGEIIARFQIDFRKIRILDISGNANQFFFPGFIDTHIHAPQYPNNGIFGNSTLLDWLTRYTFPLEASLTDLVKARQVYEKVIKRTLFNGTTCASYFATIDADATNLLANLAIEFGQKAFIGKCCMNTNSPDYYTETFDECKESTMKVIDHIHKIDPRNDWVAPTLTPRFAPSCTSELMQWLGELKKKHLLHSQTHISENKDEIEWVSELFPDCESYADVYYKHGLLDEKTILAHAIHLTEYEKDVIKSTGAGISHCPISNSAITSGECRVRWLLDNGIPVGLGTDVSGGYSPSILMSARQALLVSRHLAMESGSDHDKLTVSEVLYLGTMGGARLVSAEDRIGSFAVGKRWDAQLIDLDSEGSQVDVFEWQVVKPGQGDSKQKWDDIIAKWLFNGDDRNCTVVWVNGRRVKG